MVMTPSSVSPIWWNQSAIDSVRLTNNIYFGYGTLSTMEYANNMVNVFNKQIADDIGAEDFYTLVREDKWTLDVMKAYIAQAARDADGNGKMNAKHDMLMYYDARPCVMNGILHRRLTVRSKGTIPSRHSGIFAHSGHGSPQKARILISIPVQQRTVRTRR